MQDKPNHGRNVAALLLSEAAQKVLTLLLFVVLSRALSVEENGRYALFVTLFPFLCVLLNAGLSDVAVRDLARRIEQAPGLMFRAVLLQTALFLLFLPLVSGMAAWLRLPGGALLLAVTMGVALLAVAGRVLLAGFAAQQRFGVVSLLQVVLRTGVVLGSFAALLLGAGATGLVVSLIPVYGFWLILILVSWSRSRVPGDIGNAPQPRTWALLRDGVPMALSGLAATAWFAVDMPLMQFICAETEAGYYAIGMRFLMMLFPLAEALTTVAYPALSRAAGESREALSVALYAWSRTVLLLALPMAAGGYLIAAPLTALLAGARFLPGAPSVAGLTVAFAAFMATMMALTHLRAAGRQNQAAWIMAVAVGVKVLALGPLMFLKGDTGAIWVNVGGGMLLAGVLLGVCFNSLASVDRKALALDLLRVLAATTLMALVLWPMRTWSPLLSIPAGAAVYGAAGLLTGALRRSDLRRVWQ